MFNRLLLPIVMGQVRHAITTLGGVLVAEGWLTQDQSTQIIGGVVAIAGAAWSIGSKWWSESKRA